MVAAVGRPSLVEVLSELEKPCWKPSFVGPLDRQHLVALVRTSNFVDFAVVKNSSSPFGPWFPALVDLLAFVAVVSAAAVADEAGVVLVRTGFSDLFGQTH